MADTIINAARLREVLFYDPTSPSGLRWKVDRSHNAKAGDVAGCRWKDALGAEYWKVHVFGKQYYVHRLVWAIERGIVPDGMQIDHINGNGMDNRIENLRPVTDAINSRNQRRMNRNKTGVLGVHYDSRSCAYVATWYETANKKSQKYFSAKRYGNDRALLLAAQERRRNITRLRLSGMGYTEAHINR